MLCLLDSCMLINARGSDGAIWKPFEQVAIFQADGGPNKHGEERCIGLDGMALY
jgi:hypothetical protein